VYSYAGLNGGVVHGTILFFKLHTCHEGSEFDLGLQTSPRCRGRIRDCIVVCTFESAVSSYVHRYEMDSS